MSLDDTDWVEVARVLVDTWETLWRCGIVNAYEAAGSPYGPSGNTQAVLRWLHDEQMRANAEAETEYQRERQQMILDLSARLAAKRAN